MKSWVYALMAHYESTLRKHSQKKLLMVFDMDRTILDMRGAILGVLLAFDRKRGTDYFKDVGISRIDGDEDGLQHLFDRVGLSSKDRRELLSDIDRAVTSRDAVLEAHRPFEGVLELIRWFRLQPRTDVAIVTGRSDSSRTTTLRQLAVLEREYSVRFGEKLLLMKPGEPRQPVWEFKAGALELYRAQGYTIFAVVDSEGENLRAMETGDPEKSTLLLRTDRILRSLQRHPSWKASPAEAALSGTAPKPVHFIWHWADMNEQGLIRFLSSNLLWIRIDAPFFLEDIAHIRFSSACGRTALDYCFNILKKHGKKLLIDLPSTEFLLGRIMDLISDYDFEGADLCFNVPADLQGREALKVLGVLKAVYPGAIFHLTLAPLHSALLQNQPAFKACLDSLRAGGVDIFSLDWKGPRRQELLAVLNTCGCPVNIYNADDLGSFLQAVLARPFSITSAFNFGRGIRPFLDPPEKLDSPSASSLDSSASDPLQKAV